MWRALDPLSRQTCRRLLFSLALAVLWAKVVSPQAIWAGVAALAGGFAIAAALIATLRREPFPGPRLNRWDEAAALLGVFCLARLLV